ncbi:hypothetical protein AL755_13285 [Arthrobacter sp. ERGS1:01]|uniref:hypothetical protein n=1 Tax=Arthrobacter sp. ERGS1:01 TaxID=1704044 RepID=UPI0006B6736B|nr:hypothetical protein [Arthrobacter sp. ERGS1:01]ALE06211.1 hypothetical protein AL755_13285 [Arthrobacter sp. ERGS1:01]
MLEFEEISWVYSLTKDRYGNRMTLYIGIDIKEISDGTPPTNYIDCPITGDVVNFQPSIGHDHRTITDLFNAEVDFDEDEREAEQRCIYKTSARFSAERTTLSSIQALLKNRQLPGVGITRVAQPLIEGSTP